jgi:hypothetical protein
MRMFDDGFEMATILRTGPDGLARVITRSSCLACALSRWSILSTTRLIFQ